MALPLNHASATLPLSLSHRSIRLGLSSRTISVAHKSLAASLNSKTTSNHGRPHRFKARAQDGESNIQEPQVDVEASEPPTEVETPSESVALQAITPPSDFTPPEPKRFSVREDQWGAISGAAIAPLLRLGSGLFASGYKVELEPIKNDSDKVYAVAEFLGRRVKETSDPRVLPEKPIEIYEFEGCPFCRKVREMVAYLDLDVLFYPCPQNGPTFRPKAISMGGKRQFPYLVDPNTGVSMYESDEIIKYLADKYGDGTVPLSLRLGALTTITAGLAMVGRFSKGSRYTPAKMPGQPLEIWAYESSPFCKIVREALCELELPHIYHSVARGSAKRQKFFEQYGRFQVPYLEDPNTGIKTFESGTIIDYLYATYAIKS